jgi:glycerol-1-phosphate dehydrogenase [NAD(P)+]
MDRTKLLGTSVHCSCGRTHVIPVRRFVVERGAVNHVAEVVFTEGLGKRAFLVADKTTYKVAGKTVRAQLEAGGIAVSEYILPDHPKASDETVARVRDAYVKSDFVITCGSGTVTDIGKSVAHDKGVPLVAVATAPSMNGYASNIAALYRGGVKITEPITPAVAVIADVDILAAAPLEMIRAGLGDALAKPVCNADWKLASIMRGVHFCGASFDIIRDLESIYLSQADGIAIRDPDAVAALMEALLYSGIAMVMAGSSAPASGGEHLISHTLDMRAGIVGRAADFHGVQVGVAALVTSRLYESVLQFDREQVKELLDRRGAVSPDAGLEKHIRSFFGPLADNVSAQFAIKQLDDTAWGAEREQIYERWDEIRNAVKPFLMTPAAIEEVMRAAGCKMRFDQLGLSPDEFMQTIIMARTIRPRYNILDLMWELGLLTELTEGL